MLRTGQSMSDSGHVRRFQAVSAATAGSVAGSPRLTHIAFHSAERSGRRNDHVRVSDAAAAAASAGADELAYMKPK